MNAAARANLVIFRHETAINIIFVDVRCLGDRISTPKDLVFVPNAFNLRVSAAFGPATTTATGPKAGLAAGLAATTAVAADAVILNVRDAVEPKSAAYKAVVATSAVQSTLQEVTEAFGAQDEAKVTVAIIWRCDARELEYGR